MNQYASTHLGQRGAAERNNKQDGDVNGSMRWTPWRGNWYRFCRLHVAHSKASMMTMKAARQGYTLKLRSASSSSSSPIVFFSHITPTTSSSSSQSNSIFLSHHSSFSFQLQPAERSVNRCMLSIIALTILSIHPSVYPFFTYPSLSLYTHNFNL